MSSTSTNGRSDRFARLKNQRASRVQTREPARTTGARVPLLWDDLTAGQQISILDQYGSLTHGQRHLCFWDETAGGHWVRVPLSPANAARWRAHKRG